MLDHNRKNVKDLHKKAVEKDRLAKVRMTENYNRANKVKECSLQLGDMVLFRWHRTKKHMPMWDPVAYEVVDIKGSMIKASRSDHTVTRNSSFFKLWDTVGSNKEPELIEGQALADKVPVEQQVSPGQVLVEDPSLSVGDELVRSRRKDGVIPKYKVGRPTLEQQVERKERAAEVLKANELLNPPRRSVRIRAKDVCDRGG